MNLPLRSLTPRGQQTLALARIEAHRLHRPVVGTEHLLLGLIALNKGVAITVLLRLGLDLERTRLEVEKQAGARPAEKVTGTIPYDAGVKKVLELAAEEAKALRHTYVGTEHILLGLLRDEEGGAARVMTALGVNIKQTRLEILRELDPNCER